MIKYMDTEFLIPLARSFVKTILKTASYKISNKKFSRIINNNNYMYYYYERDNLVVDKYRAIEYINTDIFESFCLIAGYDVNNIRTKINKENVCLDTLKKACENIITTNYTKLYPKRIINEDLNKEKRLIASALSFLYNKYDIKNVIYYFLNVNKEDNIDIQNNLYYIIDIYYKLFNSYNDIIPIDIINKAIQDSLLVIDKYKLDKDLSNDNIFLFYTD